MKVVRNGILVLTQPSDVTADVVVDRLRELDLPVVRFDTGSFPHPSQIVTRLQGGGITAALLTDDAEIDLSSLRSIWYRRPAEFTFEPGMTNDTQAFARAEARQGLAGTLQTTPAVWMNHPAAESVAGLKLVQLQSAIRQGLEVPPSLITNRPIAAKEFLDDAEAGDESIYKRLSSMLLFTDDGGLTGFQTEKVDEEALARLDHVAVTPCFFQRYVPKAYEIRATVVHDRVFAAKVDSQASAKGKVDWRADMEHSWEPYELPADVEAALVGLVADLGLLFGAADLIRRPDGRYVFLEVNPSGQWAWFDKEITHPIRDAIIDCLADPPATPHLAITRGTTAPPA